MHEILTRVNSFFHFFYTIFFILSTWLSILLIFLAYYIQMPVILFLTIALILCTNNLATPRASRGACILPVDGTMIKDIYHGDLKMVRHDHRCSEEGHCHWTGLGISYSLSLSSGPTIIVLSGTVYLVLLALNKRVFKSGN